MVNSLSWTTQNSGGARAWTRTASFPPHVVSTTSSCFPVTPEKVWADSLRRLLQTEHHQNQTLKGTSHRTGSRSNSCLQLHLQTRHEEHIKKAMRNAQVLVHGFETCLLIKAREMLVEKKRAWGKMGVFRSCRHGQPTSWAGIVLSLGGWVRRWLWLGHCHLICLTEILRANPGAHLPLHQQHSA